MRQKERNSRWGRGNTPWQHGGVRASVELPNPQTHYYTSLILRVRRINQAKNGGRSAERGPLLSHRGPGAADLIAQIHGPVFKRETHVKMEMSELGPTVSFHLQKPGSPLLSCGPGCHKVKVSLKWRGGWSSLCRDQSVPTLTDPWRVWRLVMTRSLLGGPGQTLLWRKGK